MTEAAFEKQSKEIKEIIRRTAVPGGKRTPPCWRGAGIPGSRISLTKTLQFPPGTQRFIPSPGEICTPMFLSLRIVSILLSFTLFDFD
jgi:hypothetical protein